MFHLLADQLDCFGKSKGADAEGAFQDARLIVRIPG